MSEAQFRALFTPFGKQAFLLKLTDTQELTGRNKRLVETKAQPSDFHITVQGDAFYAEVKSSGNATSFPFSNIRPTQFGYARMITIAGGKYFFFILQTKTGAWYKVPAQIILDYEAKASMTWNELRPYRIY